MKIRSLALLWLVIIVTACTGQTAFPSASAVSVPGTSPAVSVTATQVLPGLTPSAETRPLPTVTLKGPYLVPGSDPASISILWQSKDAAAYWVEAGTDSTYALGRVAPSSVTSDGLAKATVSNLQPGTHYLYRVTNGKSQAPGSFNTPSGSVDSLTFWVYGDSRSGQATLNTINGDILSSIQTTPADQTFVLFSGDIMDLANEGNLQADQFDPRYTSTRQMMSELQMINTMGNHDGTKIFIKYFPYPFAGKFYWSFDYGPLTWRWSINTQIPRQPLHNGSGLRRTSPQAPNPGSLSCCMSRDGPLVHTPITRGYRRSSKTLLIISMSL